MALITTLALPITWLQAAVRDFDVKKNDPTWVRSAIRSLLADRILSAHELSDTELSDAGAKMTVNFSIPEPAGGIAISRAKQLGISPGQYCKRLLAQAASNQCANESPTMPAEAQPLVDLLETMQRAGNQVSARYEQAVHFSHLMDCLSEGRIGMCEAGTGTGKTLAMIFAATKIAIQKSSRVTLTFPTIAIMYQAARAYRSIAPYIDDMPQLRVILGRREFVSRDALIDMMNSPAEFDRVAVQRWIDSGGAPQEGFAFEDTRWLAASLHLVEPRVPLAEVILPELVRDDDPGYKEYRRALKEARENGPELQLCTHAMLALDMRTRISLTKNDDESKEIEEFYFALLKKISGETDVDAKSDLRAELSALSEIRSNRFIDLTEDRGLLPTSRYLIIDEGHLFEQNVSSALSDYLSMHGLLHLLHEYKAAGGRMSKKAMDEAHDLVRSIPQIRLSETDKELVSLNGHSPAAREILVTCRQLSDAIGQPKLPTKCESAELIALHVRLSRMLIVLRSACSGQAQASMQFSPIRQFPQLFVGRSTVEYVLARLWDLQVGAAIVSATLYLRRGDGYSSAFQQMILNIPTGRAKEYLPVSPAWLISTVQGVSLPPVSRDGTPLLRPPTLSDRLSQTERDKREQLWLNDVADELEKIHAESPGGVLVLMTSYASISYLASKMDSFAESLVLAKEEGASLSKQGSKFLELSKSGLKPMWLAVGGAWTGLDVGGHEPWTQHFKEILPADQDDVLTTLVIPRLPFGTNRTITHAYRILNRPGVPWEMLEMAFRFRQGLGRLVRRNGLPSNRRIYVLDGRLNDIEFGNLLSNVKHTLSNYKILAK